MVRHHEGFRFVDHGAERFFDRVADGFGDEGVAGDGRAGGQKDANAELGTRQIATQSLFVFFVRFVVPLGSSPSCRSKTAGQVERNLTADFTDFADKG